MNPLRYFHTLRHLRPVQVYGRIWFRLRRPRIDTSAAPPLRARVGAPTAWAWREPSLLAPTRFRFLGVTHDIGASGGWDDGALTRLWRYNLHYFDDLTATGADDRREWHRGSITRWIRENPPGAAPGWEPYPCSLRIVNWIRADLAPHGGPLLDDAARASLATQARWLAGRLEHHLLGNHLWANAKALVVAGLYFGGSEGDALLSRGVRLFERELHEQVLTDGGHFERSPMYHATMLEDALQLTELAHEYGNAFPHRLRTALSECVPRMLRWLRVMTHPDGEIALFNDAAFGVAAPYAALAEYARRLDMCEPNSGLRDIEVLPESGYVRLQNARAVVICDVAPVGPSYQPAHAHADTLSFELSLDGARVFVNGGTSTYEPGAERQRQRGTAAHNTVEVDGENSSEVWGAFRVARRATARIVGSGTIAGGMDGSAAARVWVEGEHDGYRRLEGRAVHRRRWELDSHGLTVTDRVQGGYREAHARLLLAPSLTAECGTAGECVILDATTAVARVSTVPQTTPDRQPASWHPTFGASLATSRLAYPIVRDALVTRIDF